MFSHAGRILVSESNDPVSGQTFCRPLGGGIEFGETGAAAIAREALEEIGAEAKNIQYLGTLENIFNYGGMPCHEIVQVYDGELADRSMYRRDFVAGVESDGQPFRASWREPGAFGPDLPLFPVGLVELLRTTAPEVKVAP